MDYSRLFLLKRKYSFTRRCLVNIVFFFIQTLCFFLNRWRCTYTERKASTHTLTEPESTIFEIFEKRHYLMITGYKGQGRTRKYIHICNYTNVIFFIFLLWLAEKKLFSTFCFIYRRFFNYGWYLLQIKLDCSISLQRIPSPHLE